MCGISWFAVLQPAPLAVSCVEFDFDTVTMKHWTPVEGCWLLVKQIGGGRAVEWL